MICYVYKRKREGGSRRAALYYGRFRLEPEDLITIVPLNTTDERVARRRLDAIVLQKQREAAGMVVPTPVLQAAKKPIVEHIDLYTADLRSQGCSDMYTYNIERLATRLCDQCGWAYPRDIKVEGFTAWRNACSATLSAKTLNEYLDAISGLLRWMNGQRMLESNPLASIRRAKGPARRVRRALTDDELRRLIAASGSRRTVYLTAAFTGLRRSELGALVWADVHLDDANPHILARASTTKNRREARLPLHPDLVEALRVYRPADAAPDDRVFRAIPEMDTMRKDLKNAGIPYKDHAGRQADFHSFRHSLATRLMNAGVSMRVAMEVMRHSEIRLTAKIYTDATQLPTAAAVESLASLGENRTQLCTHGVDSPGASVTQPDTTAVQPNPMKPVDSKEIRHAAA